MDMGMGAGMDMGNQGMGGFNMEYNNPPTLMHEADPEEQRREEMSRQKEQQRNQELHEMAQRESEEKSLRRGEAQKVLEQMMRDLEQKAGTKSNNVYVEEQQAMADTDGNPWAKICANIALKEGDYPGERDVKQMRTAIVNKCGDSQM